MSNPSEEHPLIGKDLAGRFQIVAKIGQGGMGAVYKAVHKQMGRTCAIKLLLPMSADADLSVERFKREAQLASRIDNPHAVTIYDFGEAENGALYLAMEFVEGRQLGQVMNVEYPLPSERIIRITSQIAEALNAAHALGIVHRDLKPENIMVSRKGGADYVKVLDFGIAKTFDDDNETITKTGFIVGTPYYMSPEQLSGEKLDARSDVYSLALIVYEMFSRRLPFEGDNSQAVMIKRLVAEPLPLRQVAPAISPEVERVVMSALTRDRDSRTADTLTFATALQNAIIATQGLSNRQTNCVANDEGRSTIPIVESKTNPEAAGGIQQLNQENQRGQRLSQETQIARDPSKPLVERWPDEASGKPASAYNTNRAVELAPPSPSNQTIADEPSTLPFASEKPNLQGKNYQTAPPLPPPSMPNAVQPFPQQPGFNTPAYPSQQPPPYQQTMPQPVQPMYSQALAAEPKKSNPGLLIGAVVVVMVLAVGAGVYFFSSAFQGTQPIVSEPPKKDQTGLYDSTTKSPDEAATSHYENGRKHQEQARLLSNSGSLTSVADENKKAIEEYSKAVTLKQLYPEAHENLGVAHYNAGNLNVAVVELKLAIDQYIEKQQRPTSQVLTNYGLALYDLKRYADAAEAFQNGYKIDSTDTDLLAFQGFSLHQAGSPEKAKEIYRSYLKAAPTGQFAEAITQIIAGRAQPPETSGN